ncbi:UNVERIFIED_CONTAM: hypothetical protein PYX00_007858 [Menopon gallinae]|uniref:ATP-binding cassette sub-family G member 4 n=1 Tax=Menopon gallinae TaxID=328185 RepID=A0AAW2HKV7_9NEOP
MTFAANLKLPSSTTRQEREKEVKQILNLLGLYESGETVVESLSGGQRKRLSLALEMINNPSVFFLDEPTSGLDNVSTKQCIQLLRELAKGRRTIVCTIHQPSASLFQFFDHVYFLGRGKCIYQGAPDQLLQFLSSAGFHCPTHYNPSDFAMEVIDASENNILALSKAIQNGKICYSDADPIKAFDTVGLKTEVHLETETLMKSLPASKFEPEQYSDPGEYPTSCRHQFWVLLQRMIQQHGRNLTGLKILFVHHLACGLLFGWVFFKSANDAYQMFNHMKFCVGYVLFYTYTHVMMPVLTYPSQVKLLKKEHFNRWYSLNSYYAAMTVIKLPTQLIFGLMFSFLVYFMSGLPAQTFRFALFSFIGFVVTLVADSVGMAIGSIFNVTNGSAVGPAIVAPLLGLAVYGFDFARQVSWFTYAIMKLSFIRCAVVATAITIFGFGRGPMECNEVYCHFKEPKLVLDFLDIEHVSVWSEIAALFLILIFFRIVNYCCLKYRVSIK